MQKDEKNVLGEKTENSSDKVKKSVNNDVDTSTESGVEKKKADDEDELVNTPYDDAYRTMINDASELILPVLNEIFGEHYTGSEKIVFTKDTHIMNRQDGRGQRRTTDSSFAVIGYMTNYYLLELQSRPDSSLLIRFFEYGTQVALDEGE